MALTKALVENSFKAARTMLAGSAAQVRHNGNIYAGIRSSVEFSDQPGEIGSFQGLDGAVRLLISEFKEPNPSSGETIEIKNKKGGWDTRRIVRAREDEVEVTVIIYFEEQS